MDGLINQSFTVPYSTNNYSHFKIMKTVQKLGSWK